MSVRVMSKAWDADLPATDKLVLLALADWSNDGGQCWPSIAQLRAKCGLSERAVQGAIKRLKDDGHLSRNEKAGKGVDYTIHPRTTCTPADNAPPQEMTDTPAPRAPNTSVTIIEDEREQREREILELPQWKAFKAMRREIKKPVNPTAECRLLSKLIGLADAGYPPGEVLDQSTEHCWQGVFKIEEREDGRSAYRANQRSMGGPRPSSTLAMLRAANGAIARDREDHGGTGPPLSAAQHG